MKEKRYQMFLNKRKETDEYKQELECFQQTGNQLRREREQQNYERKMLIRQQKEKGKQKELEFKNEKRLMALREKEKLRNVHRDEIYTYE